MTTHPDSDNEQLEDSHGFFQFAAFSDSDDDDDGLFNAPRDRTVAFDVKKINYTPKIDEDRWYDLSDQLSIEDWLSRHGGLDEITFTVQRMYFTKNYAKSCSLCKKTVSVFVARPQKHMRVATVRELLEIGAKSAIRIDDLEAVRFFYDWYLHCGGKNPGYSYFLAEVLTALGQHEDALVRHIEYLVERHQDAHVWELLGNTLVAIYNSRSVNSNRLDPDVWLRLALCVFYKSHTVIGGCKNWVDTPLAIQRKRLQEDGLLENVVSTLNLLFAQIGMVLQDGDLCDSTVAWNACAKESNIDESQQAALLGNCKITEFRESVEWVMRCLINGVDKDMDLVNDDDDEDEKHVSNL
ncbi:hypothetical protein EV175_000826 [Coemansia sp. RSA 1933]|nr:hypothetical protein EV175_000826 [Coemansia sp. RSA 1933]